jgi:hypothetical protein
VRSFQAPARVRGRHDPASWDRAWRLDPSTWQLYLADPGTVARYHAKVLKRQPELCWYWLGAVSSTGHGKLRAGTRAPGTTRPPSRVVASHVYGWQLSRGLLRRDGDLMPLIRHRCDSTSCHNPAHWQLGTGQSNAEDYRARMNTGPLADRRGPAGRAMAIRDAILAALAAGENLEMAITRAEQAGLPTVQDTLF